MYRNDFTSLGKHLTSKCMGFLNSQEPKEHKHKILPRMVKMRLEEDKQGDLQYPYCFSKPGHAIS